MAEYHHTAAPAVLARDIEGEEHTLSVVGHAEVIAIEDDQVTRVLHPAAAVELGILLIQAARGRYTAAIVGPVSGSF